MPDWKIQRSLPYQPRPYINSLPTELFDMIIREYSTVSIDLRRNSAMDFLVTCPTWRAMGQSRQHLFNPDRLVVSGHDELQQLLSLHKKNMVPKTITSLTVNLSPYPNEGLAGNNEVVDAMTQIYRDLDGLRSMLDIDWNVSRDDNVISDWKTLKLDHFSLYVNLSAIPTPRPYLKGWTWHWVFKIGQQWGERGWKGRTGLYGGGYYSYWDRQ